MTHSMRFDVFVAGWKLYTKLDIHEVQCIYCWLEIISMRFNVSIAGWKLYTELDIYYYYFLSVDESTSLIDLDCEGKKGNKFSVKKKFLIVYLESDWPIVDSQLLIHCKLQWHQLSFNSLSLFSCFFSLRHSYVQHMQTTTFTSPQNSKQKSS